MKNLNFLNFYNLPGEGIVAEFDNGEENILFDVQGLEYLIIQNRKKGIDTSIEERVLSQMRALHPSSIAPFENKFI